MKIVESKSKIVKKTQLISVSFVRQWETFNAMLRSKPLNTGGKIKHSKL